MTYIQKLLGLAREAEPEINLGPITPDEPAAAPMTRLDRTRRSIAGSLDLLRGHRETIIRDLDLARKAFDAESTRMNNERRELEICIAAMEAAEAEVRKADSPEISPPPKIPIMRHTNIAQPPTGDVVQITPETSGKNRVRVK